MSEFKVGDRVRILSTLNKNKLCEITYKTSISTAIFMAIQKYKYNYRK